MGTPVKCCCSRRGTHSVCSYHNGLFLYGFPHGTQLAKYRPCVLSDYLYHSILIPHSGDRVPQIRSSRAWAELPASVNPTTRMSGPTQNSLDPLTRKDTVQMKILVAHDGSEQADKVLQKAVDIASLAKASLVVLTVIPDLCMMEISVDDCKKMYETMTEESKKRLDTLKASLAGKGVAMETDVQFGNAADTILAVAADRTADLIVVGSHGRHGAKKFLLGSVSSKVVTHAGCDVLVVR